MSQSEPALTPASVSSPKIDAAERDVALAQAKFSADLERVSYVGRNLKNTIVSSARPALIGVAVVTGVALVVAALRSQRPRPVRLYRPASTPPFSIWRELGRTAVTAFASSAGRYIAANVLRVGAHHAMARLGSRTTLRPPMDP